MRRRSVSALLVCATASMAAPVPVYAAPRDVVFGEAVVPAGLSPPPGVRRLRPVRLDHAALASMRAGSTGRLRLFDDATADIVIERTEATPGGARILYGRASDVPHSSVTLVVDGSIVAGAIRLPGQGLFEIRPAPGGLLLVREADAELLTCGGGPGWPAGARQALNDGTAAMETGAAEGPAPGPLATTPHGYRCDDGSVVDLMAVYTQAALNAAGGVAQINALIDLAIADTNAAYVRSQVNTSIRKVYAGLINYTETGVGDIDGPRLFTEGDGYLDDVHPLRNQYGADCVSLWVQSLDSGGIGYYPHPSLEGIGASGFSAMRQDSAAYLTLAHEIGHNFWCAHDLAHAVSGTPFASYSYGFREPGGAWYTIMAYQNDPPNPPGTMIPYFANPNVNWPGPTPPNPGPTGVPEGQPNPSDVARTHNELKGYIANFRATAVAGLPGVLYVRATAPAGGNGQSWGTALRDLQDALCLAAGSNGAVQQIWVAAGTYRPDRGGGDRLASFHLQSGLAIYGGFAGTESQLAQRNIAANTTILSGDIGLIGTVGDNTYHVVTGTGRDETARLDGFTITGGNADGGTDEHDGGGGLSNYDGGNPIIANCTFTSNHAARYGGAVRNYKASPTFEHCTFADNVSTGTVWPEGGGAVYSYDQCHPTFTSCTFSGNSANIGGAVANLFDSGSTVTGCTFTGNAAIGADANGAAFYAYSDSTPVIEGCTFTENDAAHGGGLYIAFNCDAEVTACTFTGNTATADGGGLYAYSESDVVVTGCTFSANSANTGAGMIVLFNAAPTVRDCTFDQNTGSGANNGGSGLYYYSAVHGTVTNSVFSSNSGGFGAGMGTAFDCAPRLVNCVFRQNTATGGNGIGGGLSNYSNCNVELVNVLFTGNTAAFGGAILNQFTSNPVLTNCTLSGNAASAAAGGIYSDQSTPVIRNSILWGNSASGGTSQSAQIIGFNGAGVAISSSTVQGWNGSFGGVNNNGSNPLFVDADGADNVIGTADDNPRPQPGSPAINTGDNASVPTGIVSDLDGGPRILEGIVDRGAYESVPAIPGDFNDDGDVDLADFAQFQACATRATVAQPNPACADAKLDADADVDMSDFGLFQRCYTGENRPGSVTCAE